MSAYNRLNGTYCSENAWLLTAAAQVPSASTDSLAFEGTAA